MQLRKRLGPKTAARHRTMHAWYRRPVFARHTCRATRSPWAHVIRCSVVLAWLGVLASSFCNLAHSDTHAPGASVSPRSMRSMVDVIPLPPAHLTLAQQAGYIVPTPEFLATIFHAMDDRQGLTQGDRAVIDAGATQGLQRGDRLTIIRRSSPIYHPVTNEVVGMVVATLGYATVVHVQPTVAVLQLTKTFDTAEVGDQVIPFEAPQHQATSTALSSSPRDIRGVVVATKEAKISVGEGDIVYLDQGGKQGVRVGDRFIVFREGDTVWHPRSQRPIHLPRQVFGELTVLDVRDHTSTALITSSQRELSVGTPVELSPPEPHLLEAKAPQADETSPGPLPRIDLAQLTPCLEAAGQAIHAAEVAGATNAELAPARSALASAEQRLQQAKVFLTQGDVERARSHLDAAQADCLSARDLSQQAGVIAASRVPAALERYTVQRGDTLWGISGQETIYHDPFMWPMIYKANRDQIHDPDLIVPQQTFAIPRGYTREEAETVRQRARNRGPWQVGDGPDTYILEGVRR
jgi:hypothetical protein